MNYSLFIRFLTVFAFVGNLYSAPAEAQGLLLPKPGGMVALSPAFNPPVLKGIKVDANNPFKFDFILDKGPSGTVSRAEIQKLIKYFLASLTIPEKDLWVNLSPYEKDRVVPQAFGRTEMGRDLLAQDYLLKQITASLIYPEHDLGKTFWAKVYKQAQAKYGAQNVPVNTFNKVWIVPDKAVVYENGGVAYVMENHLNVMLEEDYLALSKNAKVAKHTFSSQIVREIVIPELIKEVNHGRNFAKLRQVFYSLILATWYKKKIKESVLNKVYSDRGKIAGVAASAQDKEKIYQSYLAAFKKGVFNYIKEDIDPATQQSIPRKYFSGGVQANHIGEAMIYRTPQQVSRGDFTQLNGLEIVSGSVNLEARDKTDRAMQGADGINLSNMFVLLNSEMADQMRVLSQGIRFLSEDVARGNNPGFAKLVNDEIIGPLTALSQAFERAELFKHRDAFQAYLAALQDNFEKISASYEDIYASAGRRRNLQNRAGITNRLFFVRRVFSSVRKDLRLLRDISLGDGFDPEIFFHKESVDFNAFVKPVLDSFKEQFPEVSLQYEPSSGTGLVLIDQQLFEMAVSTLLSNVARSLKTAPSDTQAITIKTEIDNAGETSIIFDGGRRDYQPPDAEFNTMIRAIEEHGARFEIRPDLVRNLNVFTIVLPPVLSPQDQILMLERISHDFKNVFFILEGGVDLIGNNLDKEEGGQDAAKAFQQKIAGPVDAMLKMHDVFQEFGAAQNLEVFRKHFAGLQLDVSKISTDLVNLKRKYPAIADSRDIKYLESGLKRISDFIDNTISKSGEYIFYRIQKEPVNINSFLEEIRQALRQRFLQSNTEFIIHSPAGLRVPIDQVKLRSALLNLVKNSYEAIEEALKMEAMKERGKITVEVNHLQDREQDLVQISVADNGPGIPPEKIPTVFTTRMESAKGKGLGLGQAYNTILGHGGTIRLLTSLRGHTEFIIRLPMDGKTLAHEGKDEDRAQAAQGSARNGGIDLNAKNFDLQVRSKGPEFQFNFNGQNIDPANITGARFLIRSVTPLTNIASFLGLPA